VRRDTGEKYEEFLARLAKESGIETPTREQLAKLDRKRTNKGNNDDWKHPHDPDARITKVNDGRTHLAHKAEHAVDWRPERSSPSCCTGLTSPSPQMVTRRRSCRHYFRRRRTNSPLGQSGRVCPCRNNLALVLSVLDWLRSYSLRWQAQCR
jgi:hypothetical protein